MRGNYTKYISGSNPRQKLRQGYMFGVRGGNIGRFFKNSILNPMKSAAEGALKGLVQLGTKKGADFLIKEGAKRLPGLISGAMGRFGGSGVAPPEMHLRLQHPTTGVNINEFYGSGMSKLDPKAQQRMAEGLAQINRMLGI